MSFLAVLSLAIPSTVQAYDGLSDLLGEVFRGLTGQKKQAAPAVRQLQQFPPPPEAEMKNREQRLTIYATALKHWIDLHCELSEEQSNKLDGLCLSEVQSAQDLLLKNNNNRNQNGFSDFAPVRFTVDGAASSSFSGTDWDRKINEILNKKQVETLKNAQSERNESVTEAQRLWVLNLLDQELYFTSQQRELISEHLKKRIPAKSSQLYSLTNQTYYLRYQQPHLLLANLAGDVLSQAQEDRLARVKRGNASGPESERYITFMSNEGVDGWYTMLDEAIEKQGIRLKGMAELQILYYQQEYRLDQSSVDHLQLAAKGTVLYCMADWKESTKANLRQWEERMQQQQFGNGNFGFSISVPALSAVEQHQLWKNALSGLSVDSQKITTERHERRRVLELTYVLSLIDSELWLTKGQREEFAKLLKKKMPQNQISGYEYMYEIVLMAVPLVSCQKSDLEKFLDKEQLEAWDILGKQYQINGRNVTMQMQNNGQFSFNIPQ